MGTPLDCLVKGGTGVKEGRRGREGVVGGGGRRRREGKKE